MFPSETHLEKLQEVHASFKKEKCMPPCCSWVEHLKLLQLPLTPARKQQPLWQLSHPPPLTEVGHGGKREHGDRAGKQ